MDTAGNDYNVEPQKGIEDTVNYHAPNLSSDWHVDGNNLTTTTIGMITISNSMVESSACSSAPMVDPFCPPIWDQSINGQSLGYCNMNAMLREGIFLPTVPRMVPHSLPHFPADSAFIERAARLSCFSGGNFGEMVNPFSSRGLGPMHRPHEVFVGDGSKPLPGMRSQSHEMKMNEEVSLEASLPGERGTEGVPQSPFKNEKKSECFMQSHDEAKNGGDASDNQSGEAEFSGCCAQEEISDKWLGMKKRKRTEQKTEHNENNEAPQPSVETAKDAAERQKGDPNPSSSSNPSCKHGSQGSDPPKERYIHVRARRGQATNSHSLAERVRREKISERMKFLQDLVPGCSKVTGKAVMLDEIINYVQSLQRQVEFLSMKLATLNPRLDFNMETFLTKDILQPRAGLSSSLAFPPDMGLPFPSLHPPQHGLIQASLSSMEKSSEILQRPMNLQSAVVCGGFRESTSQAPNVWEDELHNIVHNGFISSAPLNTQDLTVSLLSDHMKAEP